jgi:hypothetical protein
MEKFKDSFCKKAETGMKWFFHKIEEALLLE